MGCKAKNSRKNKKTFRRNMMNFFLTLRQARSQKHKAKETKIGTKFNDL